MDRRRAFRLYEIVWSLAQGFYATRGGGVCQGAAADFVTGDLILLEINRNVGILKNEETLFIVGCHLAMVELHFCGFLARCLGGKTGIRFSVINV